MVLRPTFISLALLAALTGCSSSNSRPSGDACSVEHLHDKLGQQIDRERVDQLQQDANASTVRVIAPGDMTTRDYNPQRLNIDIDESETIVRLSCG